MLNCRSPGKVEGKGGSRDSRAQQQKGRSTPAAGSQLTHAASSADPQISPLATTAQTEIHTAGQPQPETLPALSQSTAQSSTLAITQPPTQAHTPATTQSALQPQIVLGSHLPHQASAHTAPSPSNTRHSHDPSQHETAQPSLSPAPSQSPQLQPSQAQGLGQGQGQGQSQGQGTALKGQEGVTRQGDGTAQWPHSGSQGPSPPLSTGLPHRVRVGDREFSPPGQAQNGPKVSPAVLPPIPVGYGANSPSALESLAGVNMLLQVRFIPGPHLPTTCMCSAESRLLTCCIHSTEEQLGKGHCLNGLGCDKGP